MNLHAGFPLQEGRGAFDAGVKLSQGRGHRGEGRTGVLEEQEETTSIRGWDQERYTLVLSLSQFHHDIRENAGFGETQGHVPALKLTLLRTPWAGSLILNVEQWE